jgi:hypothetical protein
MFNFFKNLTLSFTQTKSKPQAAERRRQRRSVAKPLPRVRLEVESLEERRVMSVTYQGGALLQHIDVQGLYYGSDWYTNSNYNQQCGYLEGFLKNFVQSSELTTLANDGYGVSTGTYNPGMISLANINKSFYLTDASIKTTIQGYINNGVLKSPNSNTCYVFFVEDNVAVKNGNATSQANFAGYHGAFTGYTASHQLTAIHYAVVTTPYGIIGNASNNPNLAAINEMTVAASHEMIEAATDPNVGYSTLGWYDVKNNEEIGDIANGQAVYLNGFAVQRLADKNDQAMTPAGATSSRPVSFVLQNNGQLWEHSGSGWTFVASGVASISDQGIGNSGESVVDLVATGGVAYEYHDGSGLVYLTSGVKSAVAGLGVSYVLFTNGNLAERSQANGKWMGIANSVSSISAGSDRLGVSAVELVTTSGAAWEVSDSTGWHFIASGVSSVSAGQQGMLGYVTTGGNGYFFSEASGSSSWLGSKVSQVAIGTDAQGNYLIDLLFSNGTLDQYRVGSGWSVLDSNVHSISKARAGLADVVYSWGAAYEHTANGSWSFLTNGVNAAR